MNEELTLEKLADLAVHYPEYLIDAAVQYLDQRTGMTQVSQFTLHLRQVEGNWKISC